VPKLSGEPTVVASILDRLLDDSPSTSTEAVPRRLFSAAELKSSVARDMEALLNTRQEALEGVASEYEATSRSLLSYGLPDFTSFNFRSQRDRVRLHRAIEEAITSFESRLSNVRVTLEPADDHYRAVRFRVEALLKMEPLPAPVMFDTVLRLNTQEYVVE
jgi:type VI secretion system protein ImpF